MNSSRDEFAGPRRHEAAAGAMSRVAYNECMKLVASAILLPIIAAAPAKDPPPRTPRLLLKVIGAAGPRAVRAPGEKLAAPTLPVSGVPGFLLPPPPPHRNGVR